MINQSFNQAASLEAKIGAEIAAIADYHLFRLLTSLTDLQLDATVQSMLATGALRINDQHLSCPICGSLISPLDTYCVVCNTPFGDKQEFEGDDLDQEEIDAIDPPDFEDMEDDYSVHDVVDEDEYYPADREKREVIADMLIERGMEDHDAELGAYLLCEGIEKRTYGDSISQKVKALVWELFNNSNYENQALEVWEKVLKACGDDWEEILHAFTDNMKQRPSAKINILRTSGSIEVMVENPYAHLEVGEGSFHIRLPQMGEDFSVGTSAILDRLNSFYETLEKIGWSLLELRKDFFYADSKENALLTLKSPLTGKKIAKKAGITETAFSRQKSTWARYINTPFGLMELDELLKRPSRANEYKSSMELKESINRLARSISKDINIKAIRSELSKKGFQVSTRTIRNYLQSFDKNL